MFVREGEREEKRERLRERERREREERDGEKLIDHLASLKWTPTLSAVCFFSLSIYSSLWDPLLSFGPSQISRGVLQR